MTKKTDAELVGLTRQGNSEAFKELVGRYQGHVYGLSYSLVGNWTDAQDIAQETFIRAYMNLDQLRDAARFAAWLRRVAFSVAMNWLKAFRPRLHEHLDGQVDLDRLEIPDFQPGPPEHAEQRELAHAVLNAVASLPPKYRIPLTMFHLDGLSYQKVADFLDIPLGTAKSMVHRAKEKLRALLPAAVVQDATPAIQEVFNEHKLSPEFASRVLENVPDLRYEKWDCTFAGAVTACMEFLKEDVTYEYVMGISGGAFRMLWYPTWCPSVGCLLIAGPRVVQQTFAALGYRWKGMLREDKPGERERFRQLIIENIDRGKPVIVEGIVGPPESGIVTGYENGGETLLGRSFFFEGAEGYYRKSDWYAPSETDQDACHSLILIGEKVPAPTPQEVLRMSLEWAIELARTEKMTAKLSNNTYVCGLAAYDAWAAALRFNAGVG